MRVTTLVLSGMAFAAPVAASAQDAPAQATPAPDNGVPDTVATTPPVDEASPAITVTGGATLISDYRFRGLSQTNGSPAVQATVNVNHKSGLYVGTWASTIDGGLDGSSPLLTGYGSVEVDLYGGFTRSFNGVGLDAGLLYYFYADGADGVNTDFFEPYASLSYTIGPVAAKVGAAYAWGGQDGLNFRPDDKDDNLYVYGEGAIGIPTTPVTLKGHLGYTNGSLGLVALNPANDSYWDWSVTGESIAGPLKIGVSYVDTSVTSTYVPDFRGRFNQHLHRGSSVLAYVGFAF
jgi:uncharacterized protein (TIGR02001 family)